MLERPIFYQRLGIVSKPIYSYPARLGNSHVKTPMHGSLRIMLF